MAAGAVNPQAVQRAMRRFFRGRYPARQSSAKAWLGLRARCPQSALVPLVFSRPCHLLLQAFLDRFMIHPSDDAASTIQWLYRHAKGAPESTAVVTPARQNTYGELASRVLAVAAELQRIGVAPGMLIGIETNDRFAHLATVLACDVIGATTLSFYASEFDASRDELGRCSMLLHDRDLPAAVTTAAPRRIRTILGAAAASPPAIDLARLDRSIPSDHALRVIRSSGTTGNKKCMAFRMGVVRACIDRIVDTFGLEDSDAPDIFVPYGLPLRAAYLDTMVGLKLGRCVIYGSVDQPPLVGRHHATLSVGELSRFIRALSQGTEKLDMSISVAAGKVPPNLLAALRARCTGPVFDIYSSNETHWIAVTDGGDASRLLPGVEARIVDAFGTPVSPGQRGYLEVRTDRKVEGYLWNEPATRQWMVSSMWPGSRSPLVPSRSDWRRFLESRAHASSPCPTRTGWRRCRWSSNVPSARSMQGSRRRFTTSSVPTSFITDFAGPTGFRVPRTGKSVSQTFAPRWPPGNRGRRLEF